MSIPAKSPLVDLDKSSLVETDHAREPISVAQEKRAWEESACAARPGAGCGPRNLGIEKPVLATPADLPNFDYSRDLGFPGAYPFTRGVYPTMYTGRPWTLRQFSGFHTAAETNQRYKYLISQGMNGLSVAFDVPTCMGVDSDDPTAEGGVGRVGVAVSSLADVEAIFDGIDLSKISTSLTINGPAVAVWAMYVVAAEKQGVPLDQISGTNQNDILKEYHVQKEYIFPPQPSMRLVTDTIEFSMKYMPKWHPISISGCHMREAGSSAAQELAFTLADGFAYVDALLERGLDVDAFAPLLSFYFVCHSDFFEEIAKFRAARRIWAHEMKNRYGAKDPRSHLMRFHTQTAGCTLTSRQPHNNIVRTAYQALAAVLGGTQSLHTNAMDEAFSAPTEKAATIALRTQQILAHEIGITDTIDPLGGSYFVEVLTNRMEEAARAYFTKIEELGGVVGGIEDGFFQREILDSAYKNFTRIHKSEKVVVGVNAYVDPNEEEVPIPTLAADPTVEPRRIEQLRRLKQSRNNSAVQTALDAVQKAAASNENVMPPILDAVRSYATMGEIMGVLKNVFGTYVETPVV